MENLAARNIAKPTGPLFVKEVKFRSLVIFAEMGQEARCHYAEAAGERE